MVDMSILRRHDYGMKGSLAGVAIGIVSLGAGLANNWPILGLGWISGISGALAGLCFVLGWILGCGMVAYYICESETFDALMQEPSFKIIMIACLIGVMMFYGVLLVVIAIMVISALLRR